LVVDVFLAPQDTNLAPSQKRQAIGKLVWILPPGFLSWIFSPHLEKVIVRRSETQEGESERSGSMIVAHYLGFRRFTNKTLYPPDS
jgi:hypothetical protein